MSGSQAEDWFNCGPYDLSTHSSIDIPKTVQVKQMVTGLDNTIFNIFAGVFPLAAVIFIIIAGKLKKKAGTAANPKVTECRNGSAPWTAVIRDSASHRLYHFLLSYTVRLDVSRLL